MRLIISIIVLGLCFSFSSCKEDEVVKVTRLIVKLTDAPGLYEEVNIDIQSAEVHISGQGWIALSVLPGIYDLLKLTNGTDTIISNTDLPAGTMSQLRLKLGTNNSVKIDSVLYPLDTPSADQSGLKLNIHQELLENITYTLILDFDAGKSVIQTGNGTYKLKPVIRTVGDPLDGAIKGTVIPGIAHPLVSAIMGIDTFTTYPDSVGRYLIRGLKAGTYTVLFQPVTPFKDTLINPVNVSKGVVTNMGNIPMPI